MPLLVTIGAVLAVIAGTAAAAQGLYFERCGACHGPAGQLAESGLVVDGDILRTRRTKADLRDFLGDHGGDLTAPEIETVYAALRRVAQGTGRFREKCGMCHPSAKTLAQRKLIMREGALVGRYTGRDIDTFLTSHGRIAEDEVPFFSTVLVRVRQAYGRD